MNGNATQPVCHPISSRSRSTLSENPPTSATIIPEGIGDDDREDRSQQDSLQRGMCDKIVLKMGKNGHNFFYAKSIKSEGTCSLNRKHRFGKTATTG